MERVCDLRTCHSFLDIVIFYLKHEVDFLFCLQLYETGACVYFYFGFNFDGIDNPAHVYEEIEDEARASILEFGGTLSHHHGVGKVRKPFMEQCLGSTGLRMLRGLKDSIDPQNIFCCQNLIPDP